MVRPAALVAQQLIARPLYCGVCLFENPQRPYSAPSFVAVTVAMAVIVDPPTAVFQALSGTRIVNSCNNCFFLSVYNF